MSVTSAGALRSVNRRPFLTALGLLALGVVYVLEAVGWRQAGLMLVGALAGVALYHAAFGFTAAWRRMMADSRGAGLRAQMVMLAVTTAVFLPLLAQGELFGAAIRGNVNPLSVSVVVGAFLFGIGMQLGGACASGTLFTAGGGSVRMVVTLGAFVAGSVLGAWHAPVWQALPSLGRFSLLEELGLGAALVTSLALFAAIWAAARWLERRRHGSLETVPPWPSARGWLRGPWPLVAGALALAAVNVATLALAGRPWGITSAFALWGSKLVAMAGIDVAAWAYWQTPARAAQLSGSLWNDITSVMNFGIVLGALIAAGLAGRFDPVWRIPRRSLIAAVLGGLLLGYGARLAYGCNIGAFFSGVSSSSLHGWLWFLVALGGNFIGIRLRPFFGMG